MPRSQHPLIRSSTLPSRSPRAGSARLDYEPLETRHAALLAGALTDPRVNTHFLDGGPADLHDLQADFAYKLAGPRDLYPGESWIDFAVRLAGGGDHIGRIEATVQGADAEIAYLLGTAFWGRGYGREAVRWLEDLLRARYGVTAIWATVAPRNRRSARLLEASGYAEAPLPSRFTLTSYDDGDRVFARTL